MHPGDHFFRQQLVFALTRALFCSTSTCFPAWQQKEAKIGKGSDTVSRVERKLKNRTKNSICSGLDGLFCCLESSALSLICVSCQLCPVSLVGPEKKAKLQMADKRRVHEVRTWLTLVGMAQFFALMPYPNVSFVNVTLIIV